METDVVLLDIHMAGIQGIEWLRRLRLTLPLVNVVVMGGRNGDCLFAALQAGANGYLTEPCEREVLVRALQEVMTGGHPISADMTGLLIGAAMTGLKPPASVHPKLSRRENEVMGLAQGGRTDKDIGIALGLSEATVKKHLQRIYRKLGVSNRVQALNVTRPAGRPGRCIFPACRAARSAGGQVNS